MIPDGDIYLCKEMSPENGDFVDNIKSFFLFKSLEKIINYLKQLQCIVEYISCVYIMKAEGKKWKYTVVRSLYYM